MTSIARSIHEKQVTMRRPGDHATVLHPDGSRGTVVLAWRDSGRWREQPVPVEDVARAARMFSRRDDVYLSQNRFFGRRRVVAHLRELNALFSDLDYYNVPDLAHLHPAAVLDLVLDELQVQRIPAPSFAVSTGRGLAVVWLHSPVPRKALPRWLACQEQIYTALRSFGADKQARDAARVLRLIGTRNSRAGMFVEALTPADATWPFEALADEVLPYTRAELHDLRVQRALRQGQKVDRPAATAPAGFTAATLWEARLTDLQRLLDMRWFGRLPPGQRNAWMFTAGVAMSWLTQPLFLQRELWALARQVAGWDDRESKARLMSIMRRARMAARGEVVEWNGREVDARYRMRTSTIIDWLEITDEEQRGLQTLISPEVYRERERKRLREYRRAAGAVSRDEYLSRAEERRREARRLRGEGLTQQQIADVLGVSDRQVRNYLRNPHGDGV